MDARGSIPAFIFILVIMYFGSMAVATVSYNAPSYTYYTECYLNGDVIREQYVKQNEFKIASSYKDRPNWYILQGEKIRADKCTMNFSIKQKVE